MKKIITILALGLFTIMSASAQQQAISANLTVYNKVKLKYEIALNDNVSLGTYFQYNYGALTKGFKISPIFRFYPGRSYAPGGLYIQAKAIYGKMTTTYEGFGDLNSDGLTFNDYVDERAFAGGGIGLGYQILAGRNENFVIDLSFGLRIAPRVNKQDIDTMTDEEFVVFALEETKNLLIGPSSLFDMAIGFGYKFGY
jgi:hypothetical protein